MPFVPICSLDYCGVDGEPFDVPVLTAVEHVEYTYLLRTLEAPQKYIPGAYTPITDHQLLRFYELSARITAFHIAREEFER